MFDRHIFHSYRRPKVSFLLDDTIYSGRLLSYWERGLEILLSPSAHEIKTKNIHNLAFDQNGSGPHVGRLTVASVSQNHEGTCIRAICKDDQSATQLTHALKILRTISSNNGKKLRRDKIPRFSRKSHYSQQAISARLSWAREVSGARLENIEKTILKPETLAGNIENYIGAVQIPIGLAGPLHVRGTYIDDYVPLPIATTEGALVSSITRGALACNLAGGVHCRVIRQQMVRAPVFFCESMMGAVNLEQWIYQHLEEIREKAQSVSSVARLQRVEPVVFGNTLHIRFYYYTGDASGQNMTSACTFVACNWIEEQIKDYPSIGFKWYTIEANMSGDKKANYQNFINGRGVSVTATCFIPGKILKKILRVEPERFVRIWSEAEFSAGLIGMHGSNINFSNVIAGIFTATGQDIACVHESSGGIFKVNQEGDGLVFTAQLPSLVAGTVGGGTSLPVQRECLELMGCYGSGRLFRFAEIVAAACLALDISTGSAIVTNDFVSAHERLGRNRPRNRLSWSEINERFFAQFFKDQNLEILKAEKAPRKTCSGIISSITKESSSVYGLHRYRLEARNQEGRPFDMKVFLKIKASSRELDRIGLKVAKLTGEDRIPGLYE
ncbi:MAG: hydroxymethylglutaryl-CoA reductase, partial [Thermodesulfobacteria bacterium]|nr:hydroxymethylglutaryl-CoA reductase [Thermodesulfobacteriota bacterium]